MVNPPIEFQNNIYKLKSAFWLDAKTQDTDYRTLNTDYRILITEH